MLTAVDRLQTFMWSTSLEIGMYVPVWLDSTVRNSPLVNWYIRTVHGWELRRMDLTQYSSLLLVPLLPVSLIFHIQWKFDTTLKHYKIMNMSSSFWNDTSQDKMLSSTEWRCKMKRSKSGVSIWGAKVIPRKPAAWNNLLKPFVIMKKGNGRIVLYAWAPFITQKQPFFGVSLLK